MTAPTDSPDLPARARLGVTRVLAACFLLGITSLLMELSLLREFVYVMGSTSSANSFVISFFLVGLALGAYVGHALTARFASRVQRTYVVVQGLNVAFIVVFVLTKNAVVYAAREPGLVYAYFGFFSLVPALASGASFSVFVASLIDEGRRFVAHVYAISTIGNVTGGLLHGFVLIPHFGMRPTYVVAIATALVSIALLAGSVRAAAAAVPVALVSYLVIPANTWLVPEDGRLVFVEDDPNGVVIVAGVDRIGTTEEKGRSSVHVGAYPVRYGYNCSDFFFDQIWKQISVDTSMRAVGRPGLKWLLLGFCSGKTVRSILEADPAATVDVVEMDAAVLDMAKAVFPQNYEPVMKSPRAHVILGEFRSTLRFLKPDEKYDAIIVDVTVVEPQSRGVYTREFFQATADHLAEDGVLFSNYPEYSPTALSVFHFAYEHKDMGNGLLTNQRFYTQTPLSSAELASSGLLASTVAGGPVFEDHGPANP